MKNFLAVLLSIVILLSLCACEDKQSPEGDGSLSTQKPLTGNENHILTLEEIEEIATGEFEKTINDLQNEWGELELLINTYEKYLNNVDKIEAFYNKVNNTVQQMVIKMYEYSLNYGDVIIGSTKTSSDKYEDFEELYNCIYEDIGEKIYDDVYDGILKDAYDAFYDGILDEAYDNASYKEWSNARSNEYDWWSNTRSDVYDDWSDARSDIYDFYSDIRSELFDDDLEKAKKELDDFRKDVEKLKNN